MYKRHHIMKMTVVIKYDCTCPDTLLPQRVYNYLYILLKNPDVRIIGFKYIKKK